MSPCEADRHRLSPPLQHGWEGRPYHKSAQTKTCDRTNTINWLRVLDTAELAQIDQCVCQQLHPIMPLLDPFKAEQQSFKLIFPRKGALDTHPQCMDRFVEEAFASALGRLAVARILFDVGNEARIENALPIACGIKAAIEVEIGPSEIQPDLFGHLFQCLQALCPGSRGSGRVRGLLLR